LAGVPALASGALSAMHKKQRIIVAAFATAAASSDAPRAVILQIDPYAVLINDRKCPYRGDLIF
jgi:hypothetical protein